MMVHAASSPSMASNRRFSESFGNQPCATANGLSGMLFHNTMDCQRNRDTPLLEYVLPGQERKLNKYTKLYTCIDCRH